MTVLLEGTDEPPRKRVRLCSSNNSRPISVVDVSRSTSQHMATPLEVGVMMNGYGLPDTLHHHSLKSCSPDESPGSESQSPVATLCNLGNTCFLNSVLYTLRFAPFFLHNLHHLTEDLKHYSGRHIQMKTKSSSLGRGIGSSSKSWSSKDLLSLGGDTTNAKIQLATERLHDLYESLHNAEQKDHMEAFQPEVFLHALRDVNPIFEGNQQHDAHELLVCLLDNIRETCSQLSKVVATSERQRSSSTVAANAAPPPRPPPSKQSWSCQVRKSLKLSRVRIEKVNNGIKKKHISNDMNMINGTTETESNGVIESVAEDQVDKEQQPAVGHNFIAEDFEGVSLLRTTCVECEQVTERKETFCDICVPINSSAMNNNNNIGSPGEQDVSRVYREAVVTEEYLHETNKYWCEQCLRYNEAKRSVRYESLPRLLTLQLKRFSSSYGSVVSKVIDHMPTPLTLSCFCEECIQSENHSPHRYELFGVIMHLGATMASGHYVAYVRGRDTSSDYEHCTRDKRKTASLSGASGKHVSNPDAKITGGSIFKLFRSSKSTNGSTGVLNDSRPFVQSCRSAECCGVKLRNEDASCYGPESNWLECDDDTVRTITRSQLEEILAVKNSKNSALTPYLLFYVRSPQ
ncbi:ubiquitin specific protease 1 [Lycorma delicatula]|uniref:ubiquitin specific protease 1 n=1 Tax=Lycorma delicatula TaxID=130591 RepID=UPI003F5126F6